jgi:hypothetical protein
MSESLRISGMTSWRASFDLRALFKFRLRRYRIMLNVAFIWFGQFSMNKSVRLSSLFERVLTIISVATHYLPYHVTNVSPDQHAAPPGHGTCNHRLDSGHYWSTTALCGQPPKDAARLYYGHGCLSSIVAGTASGYAKTGGKAVSTASITFHLHLRNGLCLRFCPRCSRFTLGKSFQRHASRRLSTSPLAKYRRRGSVRRTQRYYTECIDCSTVAEFDRTKYWKHCDRLPPKEDGFAILKIPGGQRPGSSKKLLLRLTTIVHLSGLTLKRVSTGHAIWIGKRRFTFDQLVDGCASMVSKGRAIQNQ